MCVHTHKRVPFFDGPGEAVKNWLGTNTFISLVRLMLKLNLTFLKLNPTNKYCIFIKLMAYPRRFEVNALVGYTSRRQSYKKDRLKEEKFIL